MFERTLFERLENPAYNTRTSGKIDVASLSASVLDHLARLFNARQSACLTRDDYGIPDFNDLVNSSTDAIGMLTRAIREQIANFEPRLANAGVRYAAHPEAPLSLSFQVSAELIVGEMTERLRFETVIGDDGRVRVRE
ncbi:MAG TPA: type VI secretion system baseplate subunit TssE [Stellaceae bacterium]|nr:type VI secretion system baseplate subunit TssE [Stellaceae bacterium]